MDALRKAAEYFRKHNQIAYTIETYLKMGDHPNLLELYIDTQQWDEAMKLIETHSKQVDAKKFWLPYAHWLAVNDRYYMMK
jgi:intraflagellar transport protein 122